MDSDYTDRPEHSPKMFKNKPVKINKSRAEDLAVLICRMQKNADQTEKNILQSEELLNLDTERDAKNQPLIHQKVNADNLVETEELLKHLFFDLDKAKRLWHPQAGEIEEDVRNIHDRWAKGCATYRKLYGQVHGLEPTQKINWGPLLDEKLKQLNAEAYGPKRSDVEKQIAAHNILHQAIEAYSAQLQPGTTISQEQYPALKEKYAKLLESSQRRSSHLASLYEYLQSCSKEMVYLSAQQEKILQRDWSDRMVDPLGVRMEYKKLKDNGLPAHESEVNQLLDEGDRLVEMKHPGSSTIKAHGDTVQAEWQAFLNLCLAQETHLDNIENYKKFRLDAETLSESLERLSSTLDPKSLADKSNPEVLLALEGDKPAVKRNEQLLAALKELSSDVVPLKLRRIQPTKPTTVVSLCDWEDEEDTVRRGEMLNLKSNSDNSNWELQNGSEKTRKLPGACFMVPPPDAEALEKVNRLHRALMDLKIRRCALMTSLSDLTVEVVRPQKAAAEPPKEQEWSPTLIRTIEAFWREKQNRKDSYPAAKDSIRNRVALLITNITFTYELSNRDGAEKDEENMEKLLRSLRYEVVKHTNLTGKAIDAAIIKFSEHPKLKETDNVLIVIMSHGKLGAVLGVDYMNETSYEFPINNIYKHLGSEKCPALLNKPKIIIIQACRGVEGGSVLVSDGANADVLCDDVKQPGLSPCAGEENIEADALRYVHKEKEFISLLSSTPDTVSYRQKDRGTFLIQYIVDVLNTFAHEDDIEELFRKVMLRFEDFSVHNNMQMPSKDRCTLTKRFYFFPGL